MVARVCSSAGFSVITTPDKEHPVYKFHVSGVGDKGFFWVPLNGYTRFNFVKLPSVMSKKDAAAYLMQHADFQNEKYQEVLRYVLDIDPPLSAEQLAANYQDVQTQSQNQIAEDAVRTGAWTVKGPLGDWNKNAVHTKEKQEEMPEFLVRA